MNDDARDPMGLLDETWPRSCPDHPFVVHADTFAARRHLVHRHGWPAMSLSPDDVLRLVRGSYPSNACAACDHDLGAHHWSACQTYSQALGWAQCTCPGYQSSEPDPPDPQPPGLRERVYRTILELRHPVENRPSDVIADAVIAAVADWLESQPLAGSLDSYGIDDQRDYDVRLLRGES